MKPMSCLLPALALSLAPVATAAPITVLNSSFELPLTINDPSDGVNDGTDFIIVDQPAENAAFVWGHGADVGVHDGNAFGAPAGDLKQVAFLGNGLALTNIFQDITDPLIGSPLVQDYTFTIGLATRGGGMDGDINVGIEDLTGPDVTGAIITTVPRSTLNNSAFQDFSVTLPAATVALGDSIRIFLDKLPGNALIVADNARLEANLIPEPASVALLGLGGLGLCLVSRRRARN